MLKAGSKLSDGRTVTLIGSLVNGILIVIKFLAGFFGMSQALIADAVHSVSDLFTDIVVLFGIKIGQKEADEGHPFGHARIETLASGIIGVALIVTAIYLGIKSSLNIYHHIGHHPKVIALIVAALSVASKEVLYQYTLHRGRMLRSGLIIANAWHHRSDALSSVAVLLGVAGARIKPEWHILDPFAALLVSFFIVKVGLEIFIKTLKEFTDSAPPQEVVEKIRNCTLTVSGVMGINDLKVRTSGGLYQMEANIIVDRNLTVYEGHEIAHAVEGCLKDELDDFDRIIVHVDPS
ncbi:MAG: cation transporter [Deltaproteobacteria bacterium]|nr:cation transporter [Deltaproteobacteria bacterium]